jgi:hypothetical protein
LGLSELGQKELQPLFGDQAAPTTSAKEAVADMDTLVTRHLTARSSEIDDVCVIEKEVLSNSDLRNSPVRAYENSHSPRPGPSTAD